MRYLLVLLLLISQNVVANEVFWKDSKADKSEKWHKKKIVLTGKIHRMEEKKNARDNYYMIKLRNPKSKKYVMVKLYTIKNFRAMNEVFCGRKDSLTVSGVFHSKIKDKQIGTMKVDYKDEKLNCAKDEVFL